MRSLSRSVAILAFVCVGLAPAYPTLAQTRGFGVVPVRVAPGEEIPLYTSSFALVIGESEYQGGWPVLKGVKSDVRAVKEALEKQGFAVDVVENADGEHLRKAFDTFINNRGQDPESRLVFYYAGHGHTMKQAYGSQMGYLVPVDAPLPDRDANGFREKALDMQQVEVYAKRIQAKHALFLFDSCFSGSIFSLSRAVPEDISRKTAQPVRQFITSGSADEQVPDKSLFRQQFVAALNGETELSRDGYITGTELGEYLEKNVTNYSKGVQHPQYGKIRDPALDKGDFVFRLSSATAAMAPARSASSPAPAAAAPRGNPEEDFWAAVKDSSDPTDFKAYLSQYPSGRYAAVANVKLRHLGAPAGTPQPGTPQPAPAAAMQPQGPAAPGGQPGQTWHEPVTGMDFVFVPAGTFEMGCGSWNRDCEKDEKPARQVTVSGFWLGTMEVTQGQWTRIMGRNPSRFKNGDDYPVEQVSWNDVQQFISKLNGKSGGVTFRLPTEAEWEFACRAGGKEQVYGTQNGVLSSDVANYWPSWTSATTRVASYPPNALGLYDMSGNVWEWVQDGYDSGAYTHLAAVNPVSGPGANRVYRGGAWFSGAKSARCSSRNHTTVSGKDNDLGLRLARTN